LDLLDALRPGFRPVAVSVSAQAVRAAGTGADADTEQRMRDLLVAHPGDGGGGRYRWADTGLDAGELRERVAAYQERHDVPSEPLT
jgi:hypothetical protein